VSPLLWGPLALLVVGLVGCAAPQQEPPRPPPAKAVEAPAATSVPTPSPQPQTIRLGLLGSVTDAGFFIGLERGYFREQGLELEVTPFDSAARMVAPLSAGQLDVGGGSHSAGLFNAVARGIAIKLVADKGSVPPGYGFEALLFRRDLADSGQLRNPGDLRGLRVAWSARGSTGDPAMAAWLRPYGLTLDDVEILELNFAEHGSALAGRSLDASINIEPFVTRIVDQGLATLYQRFDAVVPGDQIAEVIYGGQFAQERPDAAHRFMVAYLKAARYYNDAFTHGDAAKRQEIVGILARHTPVKETALYERMAMPGLDPDGRVNLASLAEHQEVWITAGLQQTPIDLNDVVDRGYAEAAVRALDPYR
jgi:NitT/TauT family transport system substrate-binding protein